MSTVNRDAGLICALLLIYIASAAGCRSGEQSDEFDFPEPDVPYVATPPDIVERMLALADVTADDVVYDLGSGDGRIVIEAASTYGARGVGVEINPRLVQEARENAREAGVEERVEFLQQDLFETDLSDATVVTLYLLPTVNLRLRPKLFEELEPGTPVISHSFDMGDWRPDTTLVLGMTRIYKWTIPEEVPEDLED